MDDRQRIWCAWLAGKQDFFPISWKITDNHGQMFLVAYVILLDHVHHPEAKEKIIKRVYFIHPRLIPSLNCSLEGRNCPRGNCIEDSKINYELRVLII